MKSIHYRNRPALMRSTLAGAVLLAMGGAASAQNVPVELTAEYSCTYPLIGDQPLTARINSEMPEEQIVGEETGQFDIDVLATARGDTWTGMDLVGGRYIEGTATAESNLSGNNLDLDLQVPTTIPRQEIPEEPGDFDITAEGATPSLTFDETNEGEVVITVGNIDMALIATDENGEPVFFPNSDPDTGEFPVPCVLEDGEDNVLHTFEVVPDEVEPEPSISVSPEELDFGNVQQGADEADTVTVTNDGGGDLGITNILIGGDDAGAFMQTNDCNTLATGESCTVDVTFFAEGEGERNAALTIESTDPENPVTDVPLAGTSVEPDMPSIGVDPEAVDFGSVMLGDSTDAAVTVTNEGTGVLDINQISVGGTDATAFFQQHDCVTLMEGDTCTVDIEFTPEGEFVHSGELTIDSTDPDTPQLTVPLTGEGITDDGDGIQVDLDLEGETFIKASNGTVPLTGSLAAELELATGMFEADLDLDPTSGDFRIFRFFRKIRAEADIEFEQVEPTTGTLSTDGVLESESRMYILLPDVRLSIFGHSFSIGGGEECRTSEPVTINLEGEDFDPFEGGHVSGVYELPPLENCGGFGDIISLLMAGPGNTIDLELRSDL